MSELELNLEKLNEEEKSTDSLPYVEKDVPVVESFEENIIDLREYMDLSPISVQKHVSISKCYAIFRRLGLRHLIVADSRNTVVGILTRRDLVPWEVSAKLSKTTEAVVNRIAAGEIIQRPSSALKELIENSLDAGSSSITVTVKDGGLKLLQIHDNGSGIRKDDLAIVCERFTTSKLVKFDDLKSIKTFGFRGEALASITHVAHLTITTKTNDSLCAWKASYSDGKLTPPRPGSTAEPRACAGNNGTQITVEDLFYNVPIRRKALKSASEEYGKILDVITKYAVHNSSSGSTATDLHTPSGSSIIDNIRTLYGVTLAKELIEFESESDHLNFKALDRLVDCANLKKGIENAYAAYLPKGTHSFVYLNLQLKPENMDVNVHPTKKEVNFLDQEKIIESICSCIQQKLSEATTSRVFYTQTILPGASEPLRLNDDNSKSQRTNSQKTKLPENKLVRTDSKSRTLDSFIVPVSQVEVAQSQEIKEIGQSNQKRKLEFVSLFDEDEENEEEGPFISKPRVGNSSEVFNSPQLPEKIEENRKDNNEKQFVEVRLTSVLELREEVHNEENKGITDIFKENSFVGCVDGILCLAQHRTKLYMIDYREASYISFELFYQLSLKSFGNFGFIMLSSPIPINSLVMVALDAEGEDKWLNNPNLMGKEDISQKIVDLLVEHRDLLEEYFSMRVSDDGMLMSLPLILKGYLPNWSKLPLFCLRIGSDVDWESEKSCFRSFCRNLAFFYAFEEPAEEELDIDDEMREKESKVELTEQQISYRWTVQHILFPALRMYFAAPNVFADNGSLVQVADLPDLYKVFERC
ncbi:DNA mismatch repair protein [Nowakowskiella sp. JEL0078]|nr:DNA mismatch repair protein [Nowakowskiella sp. JEL0078]